VHGAVFYAVAGAAIAAAANDETRSGIITSVSIEYLLPVKVGDVLRAEVEPAASTEREDVFVARLLREPAEALPGTDPELVAWARARGTRRAR
jgi:acyl-CoA thioesterase